MKKNVVWLVVAALLASVVAAGAVWVSQSAQQGRVTDQITAIEQQSAELQARAASLTAEVASASAAAAAATGPPAAAIVSPPAATATKPSTSFTTFAYVTKVTGPYNEDFTVSIDPFQYLSGQEAAAYATSHGMPLPDNGLLFVNTSTKTSAYPLSQAGTIVAYSGSVEAPTAVPMDGGLLKQWVSDHSVVSGLSDMWKVTVKSGAITKIEMLVIAD